MQKIEAHLIESFILVNRFLQEQSVRYCLIGGMAAGYWGEPRFTRDMDFTVVSQGGIGEIEKAFKKAGFKTMGKGESQLQVVQKDGHHFQADFILAETEYQDWVVQRAQEIPMFELKVPICSPEDLIILKLIANRRQDLLDIEKVLEHHFNELDKEYLKKWFAFWELQENFEEEFGKEYALP